MYIYVYIYIYICIHKKIHPCPARDLSLSLSLSLALETLKQVEEPHVEVSWSRDTSDADEMEVLGASGPAVHIRGRTRGRVVHVRGHACSDGGGAAGGASAAGGARSPGDVARGILYTHTHTHTRGPKLSLRYNLSPCNISIHGYYTSC
jgi:hypothetical protein